MFARRMLLVLAFLVAPSGAFAQDGGPQRALFDVPGLQSAEAMVNALREDALGVVSGCDYAQYVNVAQNMGMAWDSAFGIYQNWQPERRWAVPFIEPVQIILRSAATFASTMTAEAEQRNSTYFLESVCASAVQADEINRQLQIYEAGNLNIGRALGLIFGSGEDMSRSERAEREQLINEFDQIYNNVPTVARPAEDSVWTEINEALEANIQIADEMHEQLDEVESQLDQARDDLYLYAERNGGSWSCPEGYPDPNRANVEIRQTQRGQQRVCGPVSPERAVQVTARLEYLKAQLQTMNMAANARLSSAEAATTLDDVHQMREREYGTAAGLSRF